MRALADYGCVHRRINAQHHRTIDGQFRGEGRDNRRTRLPLAESCMRILIPPSPSLGAMPSFLQIHESIAVDDAREAVYSKALLKVGTRTH